MRIPYLLGIGALGLLSPILLPFVVIPPVEKAIVSVIGDKLERASRQLAGPGAKDCGRVHFNGDGRAASNCALGAFRNKNPFRVRYALWDVSFVDASKEVSLVGAPDGHVYELTSWFGVQSGQFGEDVTSQRCGEPVDFEARELGAGKGIGVMQCVYRRE